MHWITHGVRCLFVENKVRGIFFIIAITVAEFSYNQSPPIMFVRLFVLWYDKSILTNTWPIKQIDVFAVTERFEFKENPYQIHKALLVKYVKNYSLLNKTDCTFRIMETSNVISHVTLHVKIIEQRKFEFVTTTKNEIDCFGNDKKSWSISKNLKTFSVKSEFSQLIHLTNFSKINQKSYAYHLFSINPSNS